MRFVEFAGGQVALRTGNPAAVPAGSARVAVQACGVCGTDLHAMEGMVLPRGVEYPLRPGHEVAGVVTEVGEAAAPGPTLSVGQRVVLHPLAPCGDCDACARGEEQCCARVRALGFHSPGGLADEVVWPVSRMVCADGVPPEQAALLADAAATAYHALQYAELPADGALCVLGAGGLGGHVLRLVRVLHPRARVAAVVRSQASADRVRALGAHPVRGFDDAVSGVRAAIGRPDAVVDLAGEPQAPADGVRLLRPGGRLGRGAVVEGPIVLGAAGTGVTAREICVRGAYVSTLAELQTVTAMARSGVLDLSDAVSHVL